MNLTALQILTLSLCMIALAACFVRRVSAALIAFGALVCAYCSHAPGIGTRELIFWCAATAIVLFLRYLHKDSPSTRRAARAYTAGGAAAGAFLGVLFQYSSGAIISGSAIGAILGVIAYMRTPDSPRYPFGSRPFLDFLCDKGLPAIVGTSIVVITTIAVLQ